MRVELKRLQERVNVTVLFVTHDQIEAMSLSTRLAVMNRGCIEQLGTPQDIYERPQTPFVEDFIGRVIRFRGTVVEKSWKGLLVEIDNVGARLTVEGDEMLGPGQRVLVAIRPEDLQIERGGENTLTCAVEKVLYLGSESEIVVRSGSELFTLTIPRAKATEVGDSINLTLPPEHLRVWEDIAGIPAGDSSLNGHAIEAVGAAPVTRASGSM
jgi:ABC-type Fe3+/spermidine/putrescine transport system ATPase subunit